MTGIAKQRRKAKPRPAQHQQQRADAKPQAQRAVPSESRRPKLNQAQEPTATAAIDATPQARQKKSQLPMYVTIGLVLLSLALLWHFALRQ
jgi:cobalamin biosynthesis Mg chelatase CobN